MNIKSIILFTLFIAGTIFLYGNYFYTKYYYINSSQSIEINSKIENNKCQSFCKIVEEQRCKEWINSNNTNICMFACDNYFKQDALDHSDQWNTILRCVENVSSPASLQICEVACSPLTEI